MFVPVVVCQGSVHQVPGVQYPGYVVESFVLFCHELISCPAYMFVVCCLLMWVGLCEGGCARDDLLGMSVYILHPFYSPICFQPFSVW